MGQGSSQLRRGASVWAGMAYVIGSLLIGHIQASPRTAAAKHAPAVHPARPDILFVQTLVYVSGSLTQRFPKGSVIARLTSPLHAPVRLTEDFFAAADPQPNFDATRILFSGQKTQNDRWQIWEMDLDGSHKRQVTKCTSDCLRGAYLPADEIVFTVETTKGRQLVSHLAIVKSDGSNFAPITFGSAPFELETVLRDGRIVVSAPWPLRGAGETSGTRLLYTLHPDGTSLESFRCDHGDKAIQADAVELVDGSVIFVRRAIVGAAAGGALEQLKPGDLHATSLGNNQAVYESPRQLSDNELVLAKASLTATNVPGRFDLYLFDLKTGTAEVRLYADTTLSGIQPTPILPHAVPKHFWDTLNPESSTGNFISLDSYLSADEARGRIATPISRIRVLAWNPNTGQESELGNAPVEADGSFFVQVSANVPVRFVLLDAKGQVIREEHGWVWSRPGEERGCTGCHGDKSIAPENRWPLTLRRFDTPTPLGESEHGPAPSQAK